MVKATKDCEISSFQGRLQEETEANANQSVQPSSAAIVLVSQHFSRLPRAFFLLSHEIVYFEPNKPSEAALPLSAK